jgi:rhamnogalacturonyl hydrolase YesR
MRWDPDRGVFDPASGAGRRAWNLQIGGRKQSYWYIGIAMYAFARLYRATGDDHWTESADKVLEFALACRDDFFRNMNTSKVAWGAAQMAKISTDPRYRSLAMEVADWMAESQHPSGIWVRNPDAHDEKTQPLPITLDTTLDRAFYLTETIAALA